MKHLVTLLILFGAIFLYPIHSRAELCSLSYSLVNPNQKEPLQVDLPNVL